MNFNKKLKLIHEIRDIDADYVIMDLGGETTYNVLDFFLTADRGIIVTTCDPASYLNAYNFIKVALYRKLNRIFGPEYSRNERRNILFENLIHGFVMNTNGGSFKTVQDLTGHVEKEYPAYVDLVHDAVSGFRPFLLVNRSSDTPEVHNIVKRICDVSRKMLSAEVSHLGTISYHGEIEKSSRELYPAIVKNPRSDFASEIALIVEALFDEAHGEQAEARYAGL